MTLEPQPPSSHPPSEHTRSSPENPFQGTCSGALDPVPIAREVTAYELAPLVHGRMEINTRDTYWDTHTQCEDGGHSVQAVSHPAVSGPFVRTYALTYMRTMSEWRPDSCAGHAYLVRAPVKSLESGSPDSQC